MSRIAVLGAGSFGTALALVAARRGHETTLWGWGPDDPDAIDAARENARYMPGLPLPPNLRVTSDIKEACRNASIVLGVVPSGATRDVAAQAGPHLGAGCAWVSATKGLEPGTHRRMSEVAREVLPASIAIAALSGPSFAREVADGRPTAVVIACEDLSIARDVQDQLSGPSFRAYASSDVAGVELGGALKNVIAIAGGMLSGLDLGHDALAALITRGLREITSLGVALGGRRETFVGLAGLGDLVLTCTGGASRNRRLGEALARGLSLEQARREVGQVAEGVETCERALSEARRHGIEMPITQGVADVLFHGRSARGVVDALMQRSLKDEE